MTFSISFNMILIPSFLQLKDFVIYLELLLMRCSCFRS